MPPATFAWHLNLVDDDNNTTILTPTSSSGKTKRFEILSSRGQREMTRRVLSGGSRPTVIYEDEPMVVEGASSQNVSQEEGERPNKNKKNKRRIYRSWHMIRVRIANVVIVLTLMVLLYVSHQGRETYHPITTTEKTANSIPLLTPVADDSNHHMTGVQKNNNGEANLMANETFAPDIIHLIHTRFMQTQPHLIDLGLARLELFKSFTLPSLLKQSSQNYLWVIRTDPDLNETLKEPLLEALKYHENHLLIASNNNPNIHLEDLVNIDPKLVWSGDVDKAKSYMFPSTPTSNTGVPGKVLESRLDADDAIHRHFVETLQKSITESLPPKDSWRIWCASRHVEWQYHAVWESEEESSGDTSVGALLSLRDKQICISTGLTIGYTRDMQSNGNHLPAMRHQELAHKVSTCQYKKKKKQIKNKCVEYLELFPTALRARTPTSAGMLNIMLKSKQQVSNRQYFEGAMAQESHQDDLWTIIDACFGFSIDHAQKLHSYLHKNMREIAKDNLMGQCTKSHSCKESAQKLLAAIIENPNAI